MKKYLLIIPFLVLSFYISKDAFALGEIYNDTTQGVNAVQLFGQNDESSVGIGIDPTTGGNLHGITLGLWFNSTSTNTNAKLRLYRFNSVEEADEVISANDPEDLAFFQIATSSPTDFTLSPNTTTTVTFSFNPLVIDTTKHYVITGYDVDGLHDGAYLVGKHTGAISPGDALYNFSGTLGFVSDGHGHYIQMNNTGSVSGDGSEIEIVFPQNGTTTVTFSPWLLRYNLSQTYANNIFIDVKYGQSSSSYTFRERGTIKKDVGQFYRALPVTNTLSATGTYYAFAELWTSICINDNCVPTILAESDQISFVITATGTPAHFDDAFDFDALDEAMSLAARCGTGGLWDNIKWCTVEAIADATLFVFGPPSPQSMSYFNTSVDNLQSTFPFNIFFEFHETAESALAAGSTTTAAIQIPMVFNSSTITINASTTSNLIGENSYYQIQQFIKHSIWLGTGLILVTLAI